MGEDLNFGKILKKLKIIHEQFPDLRFGEVIQKAVDNIKRGANIDLHDISSKKILKALGDFEIQTRDKRNKIKKGDQ